MACASASSLSTLLCNSVISAANASLIAAISSSCACCRLQLIKYNQPIVATPISLPPFLTSPFQQFPQPIVHFFPQDYRTVSPLSPSTDCSAPAVYYAPVKIHLVIVNSPDSHALSYITVHNGPYGRQATLGGGAVTTDELVIATSVDSTNYSQTAHYKW